MISGKEVVDTTVSEKGIGKCLAVLGDEIAALAVELSDCKAKLERAKKDSDMYRDWWREAKAELNELKGGLEDSKEEGQA